MRNFSTVTPGCIAVKDEVPPRINFRCLLFVRRKPLLMFFKISTVIPRGLFDVLFFVLRFLVVLFLKFARAFASISGVTRNGPLPEFCCFFSGSFVFRDRTSHDLVVSWFGHWTLCALSRQKKLQFRKETLTQSCKKVTNSPSLISDPFFFHFSFIEEFVTFNVSCVRIDHLCES